MKWIAQKIKERRIELNLTQEQTAKAGFISRPTYIGFEKGEVDLRAKNLDKISRYLSIRIILGD